VRGSAAPVRGRRERQGPGFLRGRPDHTPEDGRVSESRQPCGRRRGRAGSAPAGVAAQRQQHMHAAARRHMHSDVRGARICLALVCMLIGVLQVANDTRSTGAREVP